MGLPEALTAFYILHLFELCDLKRIISLCSTVSRRCNYNFSKSVGDFAIYLPFLIISTQKAPLNGQILRRNILSFLKSHFKLEKAGVSSKIVFDYEGICTTFYTFNEPISGIIHTPYITTNAHNAIAA